MTKMANLLGCCVFILVLGNRFSDARELNSKLQSMSNGKRTENIQQNHRPNAYTEDDSTLLKFRKVLGKTMAGTVGRRKSFSRRRIRSAEPGLSADEVKELLYRHNYYRSREGASNMEYLIWNDELSRMAQDHVKLCIWEHGDPFRAGYNTSYDMVGENLHYTTGARNFTLAVERWYEEKAYYNYQYRNCTAGQQCGHYTQVVWAASREIGCGVHVCPVLSEDGKIVANNSRYLACNYGPRGNYKGAPPYLKGEACSQCVSEETGCKMGLCYSKTDAVDGATLNFQGNISMWTIAWAEIQDIIKDSINHYCDENRQACCGPDSTRSTGHFLSPGQLTVSPGSPNPTGRQTFAVVILAKMPPKGRFCEYDSMSTERNGYLPRNILTKGLWYNKTSLISALRECCDLLLVETKSVPRLVTSEPSGIEMWKKVLIGLFTTLVLIAGIFLFLFKFRRNICFKRRRVYDTSAVVNGSTSIHFTKEPEEKN